MKVTINNHELTIGWNYESRVINKAMSRKNLSKDDFNGKNKKQIAEMLGLKSYPLPDTTHCIITDTVTGDRFLGTVKRYIGLDTWDREQARKRALAKAVWNLFPEGGLLKTNEGKLMQEAHGIHNPEQSANRKKFWDAYHNRISVDPSNNIKKCIKGGLFSLEDIREYVNQNHNVFVMH